MPKRSFRKGKRKGKGIKRRTRKQKLYNMRGCSNQYCGQKQQGGEGCGAYECPIAPLSMKGGCGGACPMSLLQTGGNSDSHSFYKPPPPIPGPFVGQAWTPTVSGWPGVNGVSSDNNYLAQNLYKNGDPQTMMKLGGSKKRKGRKNKSIKKGGGLLPQDLVNLGRDMSFNFKSVSNALNGYSAPTNPLPYIDQYKHSVSANKAFV